MHSMNNVQFFSINYFSEVFCLPLVLQNTTSSITNVQKVYPYDLTITYNCSDPEFLFPGGYNEIEVTCKEDGHWSTALPISGCDGKH